MMHDLHEAQTYLYASTGTGPYNEALDPITVDEWWLLAKTEVMEMTKRGVPGVWTYGFYDGWTPNYMFFIAHTHNAIGRFYEVQSYGPDNYEATAGATHDQPRVVPPEPAAAVDQVGTAQQHQHPAVGAADRAEPRREEPRAVSRELLAEEQAAVEEGKTGAGNAWVIPAAQYRKGEAVDASTNCAARAWRCTARRAPSRPAPSTSPPATTSSAAISPIARWPRCTSACSTSRRPIRGPTTTPAGRSSTCATSSCGRWPTRRSSTSR